MPQMSGSRDGRTLLLYLSFCKEGLGSGTTSHIPTHSSRHLHKRLHRQVQETSLSSTLWGNAQHPPVGAVGCLDIEKSLNLWRTMRLSRRYCCERSQIGKIMVPSKSNRKEDWRATFFQRSTPQGRTTTDHRHQRFNLQDGCGMEQGSSASRSSLGLHRRTLGGLNWRISDWEVRRISARRRSYGAQISLMHGSNPGGLVSQRLLRQQNAH